MKYGRGKTVVTVDLLSAETNIADTLIHLIIVAIHITFE